MTKRARVPLGDVAEFINGVAFKPADWSDSGKRIIRIQNLTDSSKPYNHTTRVVEEKYLVQPGDLLVSWSATLGVFVWTEPDVALVNQHIFRVVPKAEKVHSSYLRHMLIDALIEMERHLHGATMKHVNRKEFLGTTIPLPPLPEQKRIATILDAADALRAKRRESLAQLDTLLQSTFIEMFGDPVTNPKGWDTKRIVDLISSDKNSLKRGPFGGALKKEIFVREGHKVYEQQHVIRDDFSRGRYFIGESDYARLKAFKVQAGDLLISCSGTIGRIAEVPSGSDTGVINQALLKITLDNSRMLNSFFTALWRSSTFERRILGMTHGTGMKNMKSMAEIKSIEFLSPPIENQRKFEIVTHSIAAKRKLLSEHLAELDALFASLQSRAFIGEL